MPIGNLHHDGVCHTCGQCKTPEGHDPCLGTLPGVRYACCGHGLREGYISFENGVTVRFIPFQIEHHKPMEDYIRENLISIVCFDWNTERLS